MTYEAQKEQFFLLNEVLYKCVSSHYKTLLSLGIEQFLCIGFSSTGFTFSFLLCDKYEQHGTAVYMYIYPEMYKY